ncbi:MAG: AAA family ATPase [Polaromonas sp.]
MSERQLIIVGGPNGSGKSTFAEEYVARFGIPYLGADAIAAELAPNNPLGARVEAGKLFVRRLKSAIESGDSRVVESTLAGKGLERHIRAAREQGYAVTMVFVILDSAELCMARIRERVAQGGHHVPDEDVRRRFGRARNLFWNHYLPLADNWQLFSNTGDGFDLLAAGAGDQVVEAAPDELASFIASLEST